MSQDEKANLIRNIYTNFEPTAYLFPTMKCNLNCCMCYSGSAMHQPVKGELTDEEYLNMVDSLLEQGFTRFDVSGGEPLLRANLLYLLAKKLKKHGAKLQLVTNGTFLVKTLEQYPFEADDFDFIAVSLDSPDEATHNMIRGYDQAYSHTIQGIKALVEKGFVVGINAVYMSENRSQFTDLLKLARDFRVTFVHILRNRYVSPFMTSMDALADLDWHQVYEGLEESLELAPDDLLVIAAMPQYIHQEYTNKLRKKFRYKKNILIRTDCVQGCGAFNQNIVITADGYVTGCVALINEPKFRVGNIRDKSIPELLSVFTNWEEQFMNRSIHLHDKSLCKDCTSYHFCKGGCPMVAEKFLGDWSQNDPSCTKVYKEYCNSTC